MGTHRSNDASSAARSVLDSIRRIVRALRLFDREAEKRVGLSAAQVYVLQNLRGGEPVSINELARRTHTDQSSVSVVAQKLQDRRLLRRSRASADRRCVEVSITTMGKRILRTAPAAAQDRLVGAVHRLSAARRDQLARLLAELVNETGMADEAPSLFFEDSPRRRKRKQ